MIYNSLNYFRDIRHDFSFQSLPEKLESAQKLAVASLPLILALSRPLRAPISIGLGGVRTISNMFQLMNEVQKKDNQLKIVYHTIQSALTVAVLASTVLNPGRGIMMAALSDMLANAKECLACFENGRLAEEKYKLFLESFSRLILSSLFLAAVGYGTIELTLATLLVQMSLECYEACNHFKQGGKVGLLEGMLKLLTAGIHMRQAIPQAKLMYWKSTYQPVLEATLKQDAQGFIYLDVPNEYAQSLHDLFGKDSWTYLGPGEAGAHIKVMLNEDGQNLGKIAEIGQTFRFRIVSVESSELARPSAIIPEVAFLRLACPELQDLRTKYGLSSKIEGYYDFNLIFGIAKTRLKIYLPPLLRDWHLLVR